MRFPQAMLSGGSVCVLDDVAPRHSLLNKQGEGGAVVLFLFVQGSSPAEMCLLRLVRGSGNVPWWFL